MACIYISIYYYYYHADYISHNDSFPIFFFHQSTLSYRGTCVWKVSHRIMPCHKSNTISHNNNNNNHHRKEERENVISEAFILHQAQLYRHHQQWIPCWAIKHLKIALKKSQSHEKHEIWCLKNVINILLLPAVEFFYIFFLYLFQWII